MKQIQATVTRKSRYGFIKSIDSIFDTPCLDRDLIRDELMRQASEFSDNEIINGASFGGIFFDRVSGNWLYVAEHSDEIKVELGNPSTVEINAWLYEKFSNVTCGRSGHDNEPVDIEF